MTSPLPSSSLAALERVTREYAAAEADVDSLTAAYGEADDRTLAAWEGFVHAQTVYYDACTPEVILSLLAMASSGAADGAREMDHRDYCPESPNYLRVCNRGAHLAARSLPPSAPSDDTAQQDQPQTQEG